tara:strand:- start:6 stop:191 length:186 start_codon:yes stop_codon:yes gene_type:complete
MLGNRMTNEEFEDKYNDIITERTERSLDDQGIEDPPTSEWDEEYDYQKGLFMDEKKIVLSD